MDLFELRKTVNFSRDFIINLCLILFIIFGLASKFFLSIYFRLDSDSVGMGLMSMEIGKHHNYLLSGYHLLSSDSLVFTELIPFQLIPQILTNYNPLSLKIITFLIFVLSVIILAYLVYFVSGKIFPALLFGALATNIPPEGYFWLAFPTSHNATILFGAATLLIVLYLNRSAENHREREGKNKKKQTDVPYYIPWTYFVLLILLVFLSVLSDTIILIWLFIPFILAYLLFSKRKTGAMNLVVVLISTTSVMAYIIKTYFIPGWFKANYGVNNIPDILLVNIPLFFKAQVLFLNHGLFTFMEGANTIGPIEIISLFLFACAIFSVLKNVGNDGKNTTSEKRFFYCILLISIVMIFCSFLISSYVYDLMGARYLTFTTFVLLILVAVSSPERDKLYLFIVVLLLIFSAISSCVYISTMNLNPNEREYNLITYLASQNLTYGYGTYWNSNIVTYLSGEGVIIRSTYFFPDDIKPFLLNSCDRWYEYKPNKSFLIKDTTLLSERAQDSLPLFIKSDNRSDVLHYRNYEIYPFNWTRK